MKGIGIIICLLVLIFLGLIAWQVTQQAESPKYQLISQNDEIEIRVYPKLTLVGAAVKGDREKAIEEAGLLLTDYTLGNNESQKKVVVTTPVIQKQHKKGEWNVQWMMPLEYSAKTLPKPNNRQVNIADEPSKRFIVLTFSGIASQESLDYYLDLLKKYIKNNHVKTVGGPIFAFYNPPYTLPFLRRNEILIEIK